MAYTVSLVSGDIAHLGTLDESLRELESAEIIFADPYHWSVPHIFHSKEQAEFASHYIRSSFAGRYFDPKPMADLYRQVLWAGAEKQAAMFAWKLYKRGCFVPLPKEMGKWKFLFKAMQYQWQKLQTQLRSRKYQ